MAELGLKQIDKKPRLLEEGIPNLEVTSVKKSLRLLSEFPLKDFRNCGFPDLPRTCQEDNFFFSNPRLDAVNNMSIFVRALIKFISTGRLIAFWHPRLRAGRGRRPSRGANFP